MCVCLYIRRLEARGRRRSRAGGCRTRGGKGDEEKVGEREGTEEGNEEDKQEESADERPNERGGRVVGIGG